MTENNMFTEYPDLMTIDDVQKALGVGRSTAYRLVKSKAVKHLRIGKTIKVPKRCIIDYVVKSCYADDAVTGNLSCQDFEEVSV